MNQILWCVKHPDVGLHWLMIRPTRRRVINFVVSWSGKTWKQLYRKGYRVVRVEVREIEGGAK